VPPFRLVRRRRWSVEWRTGAAQAAPLAPALLYPSESHGEANGWSSA